jgi:hypothetical protein
MMIVIKGLVLYDSKGELSVDNIRYTCAHIRIVCVYVCVCFYNFVATRLCHSNPPNGGCHMAKLSSCNSSSCCCESRDLPPSLPFSDNTKGR